VKVGTAARGKDRLPARSSGTPATNRSKRFAIPAEKSRVQVTDFAYLRGYKKRFGLVFIDFIFPHRRLPRANASGGRNR